MAPTNSVHTSEDTSGRTLSLRCCDNLCYDVMIKGCSIQKKPNRYTGTNAHRNTDTQALRNRKQQQTASTITAAGTEAASTTSAAVTRAQAHRDSGTQGIAQTEQGTAGAVIDTGKRTQENYSKQYWLARLVAVQERQAKEAAAREKKQQQQTQQRLQQQAQAASQASVPQVSVSASGSQHHQYQQKQGTAVESDSSAYEQQNKDQLQVVQQRGAGKAAADAVMQQQMRQQQHSRQPQTRQQYMSQHRWQQQRMKHTRQQQQQKESRDCMMDSRVAGSLGGGSGTWIATLIFKQASKARFQNGL